jgi:AcrR family transcriptional regulator
MRPAVATGAGKREQNKQANRAAILEAARRCFLREGYDAVTVRDVIRLTGLASGTFYNYFPDKESLFRALVEARMQRLTGELVQVRRNARTPEDFVRGAYLAAFRAITDDPVLYKLMLRNDAVVRSMYEDSVLGISTRALKQDLQDAVRRGLFPPMDVDYLAAAFFGAGYEMGRVLAQQPGHDPEEAATFAARLFLGGIQAFAAAPQGTFKLRLRAG